MRVLQEIMQRSSSELDTQQQEQLWELLVEFRDCFACNEGDLGQTTLMQHNIDTGDAAPIPQRPRCMPLERQEAAEQALVKMQRASIIEPSESPWASPVVMVLKKGGEWRFCVDYWRLNAVTWKDSYPLPRVNECLDLVTGSHWFSSLDLRCGYWQVPLMQEAHPKTAFCTGMQVLRAQRSPRAGAGSGGPELVCRELQEVAVTQWVDNQRQDPDLQPVILCVETQQRPPWEEVAALSPFTKGLWAKFKCLWLIDGVLQRAWVVPATGEKRWQVMVPGDMQEAVLKAMQGSAGSGHFGVTKTLRRLRQGFYWGRLRRDVEDFCRFLVSFIMSEHARDAGRALVEKLKASLIVKGPSGPLVAPLGSSVVLPCCVDELLSVEGLEVEWRKTDSETLVHLYQDGESRAESQQQDYQDRAHFFTEEIQHGNFSLRLDKLRAEDEGQYKCKVYIQQDSGETVVEIKDVERLLVSGSSRSISASVGEDVTLNCSVDSHIPPEDFEEVSWKKIDEDIQVLLYQNSEAHSSNERYIDRVELFTAEIPKGNFSLRLKSIRTEDKGVYMCKVFAGGLSANATVVLEQLGFSVLHIMMLILCISASGSALLLCCLIYCRSPTKGLFGQQTYGQYFNLGSSVVLPCHVDECLLKKKLKVEWRRKDTKTLVHLYEDGESRSEKQHQNYQDRAHFFTDDVQHGNFSLRLDNLRAEDAGEYICKVHSDLFTVTRTVETSLVPGFKVKGSSGNQMVPLGGSVVLPCQVDESLLQKSLKVEWRRTDSETLVHLYEDGESRPKKQHKNYHQRAHFITDEIKDGNFSIRLEKVRAEDAGHYTCKVYSDQDCVHSADAEVEILRFDVECSRYTLAPLGSSVVLPSYPDESLPVEGLKVKWEKEHATVHLYQDGESRAEEQDEDYQDRAHFFTDQIQHGNFSLRLDNLRAEDEGEYKCRVYSQQKSVFSAWTNLELRLLGKSTDKNT
ncbi:uncharacterized protein LOC107739212 [Sinocyclocheilus rhinocerous]|uniref:uncharacterized protein LOC107739212 n=1 Tax=Sinocyclocheilus rhinocerous TaxID=307959 RepID=UPI0007B9BA50|nr:PREDICTED: uncharacterized protein LOC107739212 [Sinocyclocheilus rhinocerous]